MSGDNEEKKRPEDEEKKKKKKKREKSKVPPGHQISITFWRDAKVQELSVNAKYLFLYLITAPDSNLIGVYPLPTMKTLQFDLDLGKGEIKAAFEELKQAGVIWYSEKSNEVFIKNWLVYGVGTGGVVYNQLVYALQKIQDQSMFTDLCKYIWENKKHRLNTTIKKFVMNCVSNTSKDFQCTEQSI